MTKVINQVISDKYAMYNGDCVELIQAIPDESIDFTIYSPPFESLYTYSNSDRDMGNSDSTDQFWEHYKFLIKEHFRTMKPGRIVAIHCMNLPTSKFRDGYIGLRDFRGEIIREFTNAGFIYHAETVVWKCPVVAMQRTKALGLLYKQVKKDSTMTRMGLPDYVVFFRKPGVNQEPVSHTPEEYSVDEWQKVASPVWMDINQSDTLQYRSARDDKDEKHICPLQLEVIERCLKQYTNKNDVVLSTFAGIGSEGYVSIQNERRFIGFELKESYYKQQVKNIMSITQDIEPYENTVEDTKSNILDFFE